MSTTNNWTVKEYSDTIQRKRNHCGIVMYLFYLHTKPREYGFGFEPAPPAGDDRSRAANAIACSSGVQLIILRPKGKD